jgi:endonuclease/exonuclease/phosphatase family metal-dependent hydrolase
MSIYNVNGNMTASAYDVDGSAVSAVYDVNGNRIDSDPVSEYDFIVMTYNVQKQGQLNTPAIQSEIINLYKPDIIGMQEFRTVEDGRYNDYPYSINSSALLQNYDGMLSKYPLYDGGSSLFTHAYADPSGYNYSWFDFEGTSIFWINLHLSPYGTDYTTYRQAEIQDEIIPLLQGKTRFIVTGDFNSITVSDATSAEYIALYKPFLDIGCNLANLSTEFGYHNTWTDAKALEGAVWTKLDTIITSSNIDIVDMVIDETKLKYLNGVNEIDHLPVVAFLKIN